VYPNIGRISCPKELNQAIKDFVGTGWVVESSSRNTPTNDVELKTVKASNFYCYVSQAVYVEWRINNHINSQYDVHFTQENPGVYKVTLS
jgi:hypothetical protein